MPLLVYCLSELRTLTAPQKGVGGLPVETLEQDQLRCFFSRGERREQLLGSAPRETALAFHKVVSRIFDQVAVVPFRFPTILESEAELGTHLTEQAAGYHEALVRLRDLVQMELHLAHKTSSLVEQREETDVAVRTSGTQYLRTRQVEQHELADLGNALRRSGDNLIQGWHERASTFGLRCFALIDRLAVDRFKTRLAQVQIPSALSARVTGPWPATEFVGKP
jgi:hypothetical protein